MWKMKTRLHFQTYTHASGPETGPETEDRSLVQSSIKLLKDCLELKHPPVVILGHSTARQRLCTNPAGMGIIIDMILMHYLRACLLLVKIIFKSKPKPRESFEFH